MEGESLFRGLPGLTLSTGSACNSRSAEPSYVLRALGRDTPLAQASLRFSLGWDSREEEIDLVVAAVQHTYRSLLTSSPARASPGVRARPRSGDRLLGEAGAERLGAWVRFALHVADGFVKDARVQVYGCPDTVAACELVRARLPGRPAGDLAAGTPENWRVAVDAPVEKLGRMLIIEDALGALRPG